MPVASTVGPLQESLLYVAPLLNKEPGTRHPILQHLPDGSSLQRPCQQLRHGVPASNIFPLALCRSAPGQQLRHGAPASNKPHLAEKNTPVWLAIWRTWAGFANSQLRSAALRCNYSYVCTLPRYCSLKPLLKHSKSFGPSAPIAYATYVSPPNEAAAWPGAAFLQITARTNPCSRHLWGTLARAVASI